MSAVPGHGSMTQSNAEAPAVTTARTDPLAADPRLRGRTYAIPFDRVWTVLCALAGGGLRGWRSLRADDLQGVIDAEATSFVLRKLDHVRIDVTLDANAQTRVDVTVASAEPRWDLGRGRRRVASVVRHLDARLGATPAQILDATRPPEWSA